jgi:hypothetical protein
MCNIQDLSRYLKIHKSEYRDRKEWFHNNYAKALTRYDKYIKKKNYASVPGMLWDLGTRILGMCDLTY